ncbi:MAG: phenol 2-monooxygenase [Bdellovibrionaceae bacterium]|nr:phenol 2-monooxygenase [Pseudobdellovibrionaceae bacterium]
MASPRTLTQMTVETIIDHTPMVRELRLRNQSSEPFRFKAGQFVMLHVPDAETGKPALRAYSIASEEQKTDGFNLILKYVDNGKASSFVWGLGGNETLSFTGPFGKVFFQEPPTEQIIFLNTGTGLAQHLSYLLSKKDQFPNLKYKMLFGLRHETDIYFEKELTELQKTLPNFEFEYVLSRPQATWSKNHEDTKTTENSGNSSRAWSSGRTGKTGYVQNFIKDFDFKNIPTTFYLCGNGGMIKATKEILIDQYGFDKTCIWAEAFD